jgi:hypothetical protein
VDLAFADTVNPTQHRATSSPDATASEEARSDVAVEILERIPTELQGRGIPLHWVKGLAHLDHHRPPTDIPLHRWRQFLTDCYRFMTSSENWAKRAAELGWDDFTLFGCHRTRPLEGNYIAISRCISGCWPSIS